MAEAKSGISISEEASAAVAKFRRRKAGFVIFKLNEDFTEIVVDVCGKRAAKSKDFFGSLDKTHMRYALYNHEFKTNDGRLTDKMYYIFWAPSAADTNSKMRYSSDKNVLRSQCDGVVDVHATELDDIKRACGLLSAEEDAEEDEEFDPDDW